MKLQVLLEVGDQSKTILVVETLKFPCWITPSMLTKILLAPTGVKAALDFVNA